MGLMRRQTMTGTATTKKSKSLSDRWDAVLCDDRVQTIHRYGRSIGLIGDESLAKHLAFAEELTSALPDFAGRALDFGAGAGLIGLALQMMWVDAEVWWLDRRAKSVRAVKWAAGFFPEVDAQRVVLRDLKPRSTGSSLPLMDIAVGRSVGDRSTILPLARDLVCVGGIVALSARSVVGSTRSDTQTGFSEVKGLVPTHIAPGIDAWVRTGPVEKLDG